MPLSRLIHAFAVLLLMLGQTALAFPHHTMGEAASPRVAHAQGMGDTPMADCHHGSAPGEASQQKGAPAPCGSCPSSMPGPQGGGCLQMASCGPSSASPTAPAVAIATTVGQAEFAPALSAPAAHDFIPDPPPPRI